MSDHGLTEKIKLLHRSMWQWVLLPIVLLMVLRLPTVVHSPGMQDEQWFAVPGWTVWNEGIPRIPYLPTRNRETLFQDADRCLMALPPALFYFQAPFHAIFPPGYPTSRLPLLLGAIVTIVLVFFVSRKLGASTRAATLAATVMAACRPLLFTGTTARPDLLCAVGGWVCLMLLWRFLETEKYRFLAASAVACGLAGLFHPFALVFAMQAGVTIVASGGGVARTLRRLVVFGAVCGATVSLWAPLIWKFPNEFRSQFFANVVDRAGPGLPSRLVWPWPSIRHHTGLLYEFAGPFQLLFFGVAMVAGSVVVYRTRSRREATGLLAVAWSSVFLTAVVAGIHPTKGYWIYPCVWILAGFAITVDQLRCDRGIRFAVVASLSLAMMLPAGGLRSTYLYLTHWGDARYHGREFISGVLAELPDDGLFLADLSYVYDVHLSGRTTMLCQERQTYWGDRQLEYEALLLAWEGDDANWADQYDGELKVRFGDDAVPQQCFVDVYQPRGQP